MATTPIRFGPQAEILEGPYVQPNVQPGFVNQASMEGLMSKSKAVAGIASNFLAGYSQARTRSYQQQENQFNRQYNAAAMSLQRALADPNIAPDEKAKLSSRFDQLTASSLGVAINDGLKAHPKGSPGHNTLSMVKNALDLATGSKGLKPQKISPKEWNDFFTEVHTAGMSQNQVPSVLKGSQDEALQVARGTELKARSEGREIYQDDILRAIQPQLNRMEQVAPGSGLQFMARLGAAYPNLRPKPGSMEETREAMVRSTLPMPPKPQFPLAAGPTGAVMPTPPKPAQAGQQQGADQQRFAQVQTLVGRGGAAMREERNLVDRNGNPVMLYRVTGAPAGYNGLWTLDGRQVRDEAQYAPAWETAEQRDERRQEQARQREEFRNSLLERRQARQNREWYARLNATDEKIRGRARDADIKDIGKWQEEKINQIDSQLNARLDKIREDPNLPDASRQAAAAAATRERAEQVQSVKNMAQDEISNIHAIYGSAEGEGARPYRGAPVPPPPPPPPSAAAAISAAGGTGNIP